MDALNFSPMENQPQFLQTAARDIIAGRVQEGIQRIVDKKLYVEIQDEAFLHVCNFLLINAKFDHVDAIAGKILDYFKRTRMIDYIVDVKDSKSMTVSRGRPMIEGLPVPSSEQLQFMRLDAPD
jgi:hypothetical protein